jgi:hypothetical protein
MFKPHQFSHKFSPKVSIIAIGLLVSSLSVSLVSLPQQSIASEYHVDRDRLVPRSHIIAGEPGKAIVNTSDKAEVALAKHLNKTGAKMYGAFWCGHCANQKELFGKEAFAKVKYIECDAKGTNAQPTLCTQAGIKGFPTWKFKNGKQIEGTATLAALAEASGYKGDLNFKN